jgi:hypothetical protein
VGPRVGLDAVEKRTSSTAGNRTRAVQPVAKSQRRRGYFSTCLRISFYFVGFRVLTAMTIKSGIFWDVTPCSLAEVH